MPTTPPGPTPAYVPPRLEDLGTLREMTASILPGAPHGATPVNPLSGTV